MKFAKVVLRNFQKDFKELLSNTSGYLNCKIVATYGNCEEGITSKNIKEDGMMLLGSNGFEFKRVLKVISAFSNSKPKKPLLLCVNLTIPSGTSFIYQLYEIEEKDNKILLRNQSRVKV